MYSQEENKLKSLVDEEVWELLKANKAIIAGGAITSIFTNSEVKDIDVYLPSQRATINILAEAFKQDDYTETCDYIDQFQLIFLNLSDKSIIFKNGNQEVQLITFKYFESAEEIFKTFDFTCCMGAYDMSEDKFIFHPEFMKHNAQKYLKFNDGTAFPLVSALRVEKYRDKGYSISKSEYLRIIFKCMSLKLNSWDDVKEHIGGMYGYDMNEFFDEKEEFSIEKVISQMSDRDYGKRPYQQMESDFIKILNKFDPSEEIIKPDPPYKAGYYYKHVGKDMMTTHHHSNKIDYSVGNIVNGGKELGIFIHADPLDPWTTQYVCIELKPIGHFVIKKSTDNWDRRKAQAFGDFEVTRIVPHWEDKLSKAEIKYRIEHKND